MFHIKRMVHIIMPAVNKNTPWWLGEGVSWPWASQRSNSVVSDAICFKDNCPGAAETEA